MLPFGFSETQNLVFPTAAIALTYASQPTHHCSLLSFPNQALAAETSRRRAKNPPRLKAQALVKGAGCQSCSVGKSDFSPRFGGVSSHEASELVSTVGLAVGSEEPLLWDMVSI